MGIQPPVREGPLGWGVGCKGLGGGKNCRGNFQKARAEKEFKVKKGGK